MKTSEQMTQNVLNRIKVHKEKEIIKKKRIKKATTISASCLIAALGITIIITAIGFSNNNTYNKSEDDKTVLKETDTKIVIENDGTETTEIEKNNTETTSFEENSRETSSDTTVVEETNEELCLFNTNAYMHIKGKAYAQIFPEDEIYSKGEYIGKATDFDGTYKNHIDIGIDGEVYQSAEDENVIIVFLSNGGTVYLSCDK